MQNQFQNRYIIGNTYSLQMWFSLSKWYMRFTSWSSIPSFHEIFKWKTKLSLSLLDISLREQGSSVRISFSDKLSSLKQSVVSLDFLSCNAILLIFDMDNHSSTYCVKWPPFHRRCKFMFLWKYFEELLMFFPWINPTGTFYGTSASVSLILTN